MGTGNGFLGHNDLLLKILARAVLDQRDGLHGSGKSLAARKEEGIGEVLLVGGRSLPTGHLDLFWEHDEAGLKAHLQIINPGDVIPKAFGILHLS